MKTEGVRKEKKSVRKRGKERDIEKEREKEGGMRGRERQ